MLILPYGVSFDSFTNVECTVIFHRQVYRFSHLHDVLHILDILVPLSTVEHAVDEVTHAVIHVIVRDGVVVVVTLDGLCA